MTPTGGVPVPTLLPTHEASRAGSPQHSAAAHAAPSALPLRIAIVNDYEVVAAGVAALLRPHAARVEVVELDLLRTPIEPVDVALYDTFGAPHGGIGKYRALLDTATVAKVVAYTGVESEDAVRDALATGVDGYISRGVETNVLVDSLVRVCAGERVIALTARPDASAPAAWPGKDHELTEREAEIVALIAQGYSNDEIAQACYLSINTVKTYIRSAYRKAGVRTRAQAVAWALRHGFALERKAAH